MKCRELGRYGTRAEARSADRAMGGKHRRAYYCDQCDYWHLGRLPEQVRRGEVTTAEHFAPTGRTPAANLRRRRIAAAGLLYRDADALADLWASAQVGDADRRVWQAARADRRRDVAELAALIRKLAEA